LPDWLLFSWGVFLRVEDGMPRLLNNPAHWHLRAQEARLLASHLEDPVAKAATFRIAEEYDRLATRAAKCEQDDSAEPNGHGDRIST
jgi:hypothetical protein